MTSAPLLDTHAWLWWLDGTGALRGHERAELDACAAAGEPPFLAGISLWEMALLVELGRVELERPFDDWIDLAASPRTVRIVEVSAAVAKELVRLPESFHRDPADRLIVASARALELPVLTHDHAIRRSRLVRLWRP